MQYTEIENPHYKIFEFQAEHTGIINIDIKNVDIYGYYLFNCIIDTPHGKYSYAGRLNPTLFETTDKLVLVKILYWQTLSRYQKESILLTHPL